MNPKLEQQKKSLSFYCFGPFWIWKAL